jgi:Tol biopolymer transport system component
LKITGDARPDGEPEVILQFPGYAVSSFSIGRDLTAVFALYRNSANLYAVDLDAAGQATAPQQLTFDDATNTYPDYGPSGRIAFHQQGVSRQTTAWLIDEDGRSREPVSAGLSVSVAGPQWHPDGKRVFAVVSEPGSDTERFAWLDLVTQRLTRIPAPSAAATQPSLSPDGRRLAFNVIGGDGVVNAWVQELDSGTTRQITFDRESMSYPRWSQDGKWLAVNIKRGETAQVGVVAAEGGPVEQLTSGPGQRWPYSFSPDGDRIAFGGGGRGVWNISTVSRRTKEVKQLTQFMSGRALFPAWSPGGKRIVFVHEDGRGSLWTVKLPADR